MNSYTEDQFPELDEEIKEWLIRMEDVFKLGTPSASSTTIKGDKFVELINLKDGQYLFDGTCPHFDTPQEAWKYLKKSFWMYAEGRHGKLYWRILPEVCLCENEILDTLDPKCGQKIHPNDEYRGYMRLFIAET